VASLIERHGDEVVGGMEGKPLTGGWRGGQGVGESGVKKYLQNQIMTTLADNLSPFASVFPLKKL
jgi:hypothetical protein